MATGPPDSAIPLLAEMPLLLVALNPKNLVLDVPARFAAGESGPSTSGSRGQRPLDHEAHSQTTVPELEAEHSAVQPIRRTPTIALPGEEFL